MNMQRNPEVPSPQHGTAAPARLAAAELAAGLAAGWIALGWWAPCSPAAAAAAAAAPAPAAPAAPTLDDSGLDLSAYRGRVVLVEFWASWCQPCRDAVPWLGAMLSDYGASGLVVIAVNLDQNRADAERFLTAIGGRDLGLRYDPAGKIAERLHIGGMPTELLFDRSGVERFRHAEFRLKQRNEYESELRRLLDEK